MFILLYYMQKKKKKWEQQGSCLSTKLTVETNIQYTQIYIQSVFAMDLRRKRTCWA